MKRASTIVTALYDIQREKFDGRKWSDYLAWFSKTLKLNCHMVVFVSAELTDFVREHRAGQPTDIIVQELEETPYFFVKDRIEEVIKDDKYKTKMKDSSRIECTSSLYTCIQYSKFKWMKYAAANFNSDYFVWMDAGLSRFFDNLDITKKYPGSAGISILENNRGRVVTQLFSKNYPDLFHADNLTEEYFWDSRSYVMGGMFAAAPAAINEIDTLTEDVLLHKMLNNNLVNNEQIALGYLVKNVNSLFSAFVNEGASKNHRNYELINILGADDDDE
ncbi:hypothetical protein CMI47_02435 [Candidatus Pacearchaeota archaeon]|nr:hypothetical protein [Candidatus Pacearchaeota archaeon]|tara:strand:+ start:5714 stop:6541 length:828 start_codon:yes stop_codon:yes gene_type:complete